MPGKRQHRRRKTDRARIEVQPTSYQPSRAGLEADISLPTTPAKLARAVMWDGGDHPPRLEIWSWS